ncbi:MAG TPA: hypothetical protein VEJ38_12445 [Candidatus Acidoferrales bacterium]|nr:hypothetical protein [Candidatus Acidoferrales bacterium]
MKKLVLIAGLAILAIAVVVGWQFAVIYVNNVELHDDLKDASAQNGVNIGLNAPKSEDEMRKEVIATAAEHGLRLQPDQITLKKYTEPSTARVWYDITVDYTASINLLVYSYKLHFVQSNKSPTPLQLHVGPQSQ